jgi:hypothetical protein
MSPGPRRFEELRNNKNFFGEGLLAPRSTQKLEDNPLSAVRDCLFSIFAIKLRNRKTSLYPQLEDAPWRYDKGPTQHGNLRKLSHLNISAESTWYL